MDNVFFFSDEAGQHTGGRYFVVAGVSLSHFRLFVREQLHHAERVSFKGKQDWKGTKNLMQRVRYIEEVLKIEQLKGAVFYCTYIDNERKYWACTVDALIRSIRRFGANRNSIVRHQGFNAATRAKLKQALFRAGFSYEIQSGSQEKLAEVRLADALCGYIGLMHLNESKKVSLFPDVPEWFVNLKNEAPP